MNSLLSSSSLNDFRMNFNFIVWVKKKGLINSSDYLNGKATNMLHLNICFD